MANADDYLLEAVLGVLSGGEKAVGRYERSQYEKDLLRQKYEQEGALERKKIQLEGEEKRKTLKETPRDVWNPETHQFETHYGAPITQLKLEKPEKVLISKNEFDRRTNAGEVFPSDKFQVVPESYASQQSPFVDIAKKRLIKSYRDSFFADPTIKELKEQGMSLQSVDGLVDLARKGNQVAFVSLGAKQAKVMGERGMLSQSDVTRYVEAGSLSRSSADKLNKWIAGSPTNATLNEIQEIAAVLKDSFQKSVQPYIDKHAESMSEGAGIPLEDAYRYLAEPFPAEKKEQTKQFKKSLPALPIPNQQQTEPSIGLTGDDAQRLFELRQKKLKGMLK